MEFVQSRSERECPARVQIHFNGGAVTVPIGFIMSCDLKADHILLGRSGISSLHPCPCCRTERARLLDRFLCDVSELPDISSPCKKAARLLHEPHEHVNEKGEQVLRFMLPKKWDMLETREFQKHIQVLVTSTWYLPIQSCASSICLYVS